MSQILEKSTKTLKRKRIFGPRIFLVYRGHGITINVTELTECLQ